VSGDRGGAGLRLFEGVGVELEYMIVDAASLAVRPIADELLREVGGGYEQEVELGRVAWSNELALHVIELKTNGPAPDLAGLATAFADNVRRIDELLATRGARLMPTAMHPWMNPATELRLWPHENDLVYRTFDRIFGCQGHGWANLQSMHINLPFWGDDELGRLHTAIRAVLPILPALAASSPLCDGELTATLDTRMHVYRTNARRVPSVTGWVVPEAVTSRVEYEARILQRIYDDLAPLDPDGVLRHEWVNSRGCIARFDRSAIEIRVLDVQECPRADIAVAGAVTSLVRRLVEQPHVGARELRAWHEGALAEILWATATGGDRAVLRSADYLRIFAFPERPPCQAGELWQHIVETVTHTDPLSPEWTDALAVILRHGCLARRIRDAAGQPGQRGRRDAIAAVYRRLCDCLHANTPFLPE
jgi:gamma-glutamyl:cysteine ligase YbdK (ATP-grasp superfamily)